MIVQQAQGSYLKAEVSSPCRARSTALQGQQLQSGLEPIHGDVDTYAPVFKAFVPVALSVSDAKKLSHSWRVPVAGGSAHGLKLSLCGFMI
jgi:hypothetical protein